MNLELMRYGFGLDSTLGRLYVTGDERNFECFTLEDERRTEKVRGETCIPPGSYEVTLRTEGGMHARYSERFPEWHKGMLWLRDVPDFEYIYLHPGNTDDDTEGCILPGRVPVTLPDGEFTVSRSTEAYRALYRKVAEALESGERVVVHVMEDAREAAA